MAKTGPLLFAALAVCFVGQVNSEYLGKFLGKLSELHHGVSGEVYAVDGRTLHIKDYTYDGEGPAAYFYASTFKTADGRGFRLRDENNNGDVIRRYRKEGVTLTLPEGKTLNNIKIFYVWCEEFDVNFGDIKIPRNFDFPRPQKIDALKGVHSISSDNIVIVDAQTLLIPNLHYDGEAPDAKFWVGQGPKPSPQGIRVPDENGKEVPLRKYDGKTVVLTLPGDLTVFDIGHFGIWCEQFTVDFGHIQIPQNLNIPPSLKMLGVSPQSKLNCEVLNDELAFEVRWAVAGESIVLQLVAKLEDREYMSFGLSGDDSKSVMIGGDVVVAWVDKETLKGYAQDYYLGDKSQCSGPTGSCPDSRLGEDTNNIRLLNAAMVNGYSIVTYQRPLKASDQFDLPIYTNQSQAIIWAIGPLNQRDEVSFHSSYLKHDSFIDFARPAKWNCPLPEGETSPGRTQSIPIQNRQQDHVVSEEVAAQPEEAEEPIEPSTTTAPRREGGHRRRGSTRVSARQPVVNTEVAEEGQASRREPTRTRGTNRVSQRGAQTVPPPTPVKERDAWFIPPIECYEPEDGIFYAQMGPTGGKRGYPAITGHVGWGISWYINGLLIPEINVVRGKTYNFITEGGDNPDIPAKYHPFYITDDPIGGYVYKTPEEKKNVTIFSGVRYDKSGEAHPTGTGRLCHWTHTGDSDADDFESFGAYQRTLQLKCDVGEPGVIQWTPDKNTPDTVYYQCFTHRYLGWKINVHDSCEQGAASELKPSIVEAPKDIYDSELEGSASIRQETMVMPNQLLIEDIKADNQSQPTVSENTLDQMTPSTTTSQQKLDQIPNTSLLYQSPPPLLPQNNFINPYSQTHRFAKPTHHMLGHFINYDKEASSFRTGLPHELNKNTFVLKRMTTTERPFLKLSPQVRGNSMNISYFEMPLNIPKFLPKPVKTLPSKEVQQIFYLPSKQPQYFNQYSHVPMVHKKPFYRQVLPQKQPAPLLYNIMPENSPQIFFNTVPMTVSIPIKTQLVSETSTQTSSLIVEISPEQASTEREPEIQTASSLLSIHPSSDENHNNYQTPNNHGFKPESIVIEGGFKPIIHREFADRLDDVEIDSEGEIGVVTIKNEKKYAKDDLESIYIPTSSSKQSKLKYKKVTKRPLNKEIVKIVVRTRSLIDSDIEPEMAAADRVESYYLPPPGQADKPNMTGGKLPSEIDFESPILPQSDDDSSSSKLAASPPDIVVTFDGKRVSGASLTAKPYEKAIVLERGSKTIEYLKALPQSVPFRGDLPPLNPNVLFNINQSNLNSHSGVLNRDLDTPLPPPLSETTKLKRVRRAAHHTPEHTAQQMKEMSQGQFNGTATSGCERLVRFSFVGLILSAAFVLI